MSDYFIFGNVDTRNFEGVYVYFNEVDDTPNRVYKAVEIAGRNGMLYIDEGRYEDVPHVYDIISLTKEAGSALINALSSQIGYHRLEDSFNPEEYYEATLTEGVKPKMTSTRDKNTFKISFTRKPQRFLMSGETPITVSSGDTILNPTHFESKPMLEVEGYGTIEFNGFEIELENAVLGETRISEGSYNATVELNVENLNIGDAITSKSINEPYAKLKITNPGAVTRYSAYVQVGDGSASVSQPANNILYVTISPKIDGLVYGTSATITTETSVFIQIGNVSNGGTFETTVTYDGSQRITISSELISSGYPSGTTYTSAYRHPEYYGNSSKPLLGHPTYIDCDLGEAYKYVGNNLVSLNQYIDLGSELPTFAAGSNEITYDNTITELKVIPRWWIV